MHAWIDEYGALQVLLQQLWCGCVVIHLPVETRQQSNSETMQLLHMNTGLGRIAYGKDL